MSVDAVQSEVLETRKQYEQDIAGQTMIDALEATVAAHGDEDAMSDRHGASEGWTTLTWAEAKERALDVAAALVDIGVQPGDHVAIMASNRTGHAIADMGGVYAAACPMSIYNTLSADQVAFIAGQSEPTVAVLENADHLARWQRAIDASGSLLAVVVLDEDDLPEGEKYVGWSALLERGAAARDQHADELARRASALQPEDPATILYTSGTTGNPKGVVLTHANVLYEAISTLDAAGLEGQQTSVSYLPFAHIAERLLGIYIPQIRGYHTYLIGDPAELLTTLGEVHPTSFFGVPRVWEKIKTGISAKLAADPDEANQAMVRDAMAAGLAWVEAQQVGHELTPEVEANFQKADEAILGFLRAMLGLDQVKWAASAAAPMPLEVAKFIGGLGIPVYDVYGMTETTGAVTANGPGNFKLGSVGRANPGIELTLGEDGEVLVRGPVTTPGYHLAEDATRGLIDEDGWVHTGDIGVLDDDGFLSIVDRKKELIITAAGKNVAPSNIENYLKESPLIGHAMAIGDNRPYVVAVLTLDGEIAPLLAQKHGIEFTDISDLANNPQVRALVQQSVDSANQRLSRPEQVKAWELLPMEWTPESEELTPTLKLKRRVVNKKYADVIEGLYAAD